MIDSQLLSTMLKLALDTEQVTPEQVMAILNRKNSVNPDDQTSEGAEGDLLDAGNPTASDQANDEGKLLESAFKELAVEDAIETAKKQNALQRNTKGSPLVSTPFQKSARLIDRLRDKFR